MLPHPPPFNSLPDYPRIKTVGGFDELITTPFSNGINALCWPRTLPGDFGEIVVKLNVGQGITSIDDTRLLALDLSPAGQMARSILLQDQELLRTHDLLPSLDCIHGYDNDIEPELLRTDVQSWHVDSATVAADTWLCTYFGPASEALPNEDALRRVDIPELRSELLKLHGGADDLAFHDYLHENYLDLHYLPQPQARPFSFGLGHLWRIATEYPGSPVPPLHPPRPPDPPQPPAPPAAHQLMGMALRSARSSANLRPSSAMLTLLKEMLHSPVLDIVQRLKHSTGMTVTELCTAMKMSYMGVKQHCVELEKAGFLDTWRRPKAAGRPEKLYRLTSKADALFLGCTTALTLDLLTTAERVFGESAPPKLLFTYFQAKGEAWTAKLAKATTIEERARLLARLRSADGCLSTCETDSHGRLLLVEHHRPLRELAARYDIIDELECEIIERLLGCEVRRSVEEVSGLVRVTFHIKTTDHSA